MRSRANRCRFSDHDIGCSASDRRWFPARPAQHVHRGAIMERAEYHRQSRAAWQKRQKTRRDMQRPCAGAHRPSEALHPTRSSDVLPRIARERVPTVPHVAKTRLLRRRYANTPTRFPCRRPILNATTSPLYAIRYTSASSPRCFIYARAAAPIQDHSV